MLHFSHHLPYSRAHFLCCYCIILCVVMFLSVGENVCLYKCASSIWPHTVTDLHLSTLLLLKKNNITNRIWEEWKRIQVDEQVSQNINICRVTPVLNFFFQNCFQNINNYYYFQNYLILSNSVQTITYIVCNETCQDLSKIKFKQSIHVELLFCRLKWMYFFVSHSLLRIM